MADYALANTANAYGSLTIGGPPTNTLSFAIGVAHTPDGYVGRIYHGGVEVWQAPSPFADKEQAHRHAVKHLSRRLAATLQS